MSVVLGKTMVLCIVLLLMCKMGEWIYMTKFWLIVPLVIMNALLLFVMIDFGRNCKEKVSKVGFGIMSAVYVANLLYLIGGAIC